MDYTKGDIIKKNNIVFKGTEKIDTRLGGHPIVILSDVGFEDDYIYFLTMSSQVHHVNTDPDRYSKLNPDKCNRLPKISIVDLKYIYKSENTNIPSRSYVSEEDFKIIIQKLKKYQSTHEDEIFKEVAFE